MTGQGEAGHGYEQGGAEHRGGGGTLREGGIEQNEPKGEESQHTTQQD